MSRLEEEVIDIPDSDNNNNSDASKRKREDCNIRSKKKCRAQELSKEEKPKTKMF